MSSFGVSLARGLLQDLQADFDKVGVKLPSGESVNVWGKQAWTYVYQDLNKSYELHIPEGYVKDDKRQEYYWYAHADNAYEARYRGWLAWAEAHCKEWQQSDLSAEWRVGGGKYGEL